VPRASHSLRISQRIQTLILVALSLWLLGRPVLMAQENRPKTSITDRSTNSLARESEREGSAAEPGSTRVPRPTNHRYPFAPGAGSPELSTRAPGSTGWWLGSAGIALTLAICGAVCVAARRYWPQDSTGMVHVVGRVSLSPRHSIFLVRAGQRVLLIGAGGQGSPTLLGELSEDEQTEGVSGDVRVRTSTQGPFPGLPSQSSSPRGTPNLDVRLGEEE
jgi:flagellar protein FliO/FliZ